MVYLGDINESEITLGQLGLCIFSKKQPKKITIYAFNVPSKIKEMQADGWKVITKPQATLRCYLHTEGDSLYINIRQCNNKNMTFKPFCLPYKPLLGITKFCRLKILAKS